MQRIEVAISSNVIWRGDAVGGARRGGGAHDGPAAGGRVAALGDGRHLQVYATVWSGFRKFW